MLNNRARRVMPRSYTLIELIMVMTVLALAAALLVPNIVGSDTMRAQAAVRLLIADLSFAQSDALANQEYRRVVFYADGSGYCIIEVAGAETTPADLDDPGVNYIYDPLGTMGRYIIDFSTDNRFEGVLFSAATIDGIDLADRPEVTYDLMGGTVLSDSASLPGTGGSVTLSYKDSSYQIDIAPFTGKLTVTELP
jgi:type II secretory pathway pseudopilin PulG